MLQISHLQQQDVLSIISLAHETWWATYRSIISEEQIHYMLDKFYNEKLIEEQLQQNDHLFLKATEEGVLQGYCHAIWTDSFMKLSKLYIHPKAQGKGVGKLLLEELELMCSTNQMHSIQLNVNIHNPARFFYERMGFAIVQRVDISLHTFWLNDYVMSKTL